MIFRHPLDGVVKPVCYNTICHDTTRAVTQHKPLSRSAREERGRQPRVTKAKHLPEDMPVSLSLGGCPTISRVYVLRVALPAAH